MHTTDHPAQPPATRDTVDLFAGPGGLDLAAARRGLNPIGIEWSPDACATRRAAGLATIEGDVRDHGPGDFPTATILLGGPPCQPFSVAGDGTGRRVLDHLIHLAEQLAARRPVARHHTDPAHDRILLVLEPLRWALAAADAGSPFRTVVLEQVPQVLPVWTAFARILRAEGYRTACGVLRAEQYGVPQSRRRAVLIARLDGPAALPAPTHRPYRLGVPQGAGDARLLPWMSMRQALHREQPFTVVSNYGTGGDPAARGRRTWDQPAATVTGKVRRNRLVGPDGQELERFTWAEAGALQSFPLDHPWTGGDIGQQIGNAVPVRLGTAILAAASLRGGVE
ncbi:DNA cytosine methyltransferase [Kitasatospora viridis]|uniref:DNA (cytosine-5-)-methyltransferase n=1 Tax=Kitasatospora viridis TaxID=281105 RepID=A0A561UDV6_9ACTN|nr:DNA cytosine methyltransferase [Kitasatospora viridis]TWF97515.1 DNA (cytosine-5)-methyltransferase 1 [Kitasatospora viridis]